MVEIDLSSVRPFTGYGPLIGCRNERSATSSTNCTFMLRGKLTRCEELSYVGSPRILPFYWAHDLPQVVVEITVHQTFWIIEFTEL